MSEFMLKMEERPELKDPVLIEGLPGIGQVGKIAAEYLIERLKARRFALLHSYDFPPQVLVKMDGVVESMRNEFYYHRGGSRDLILVTGNTQAATNEGQYRLSEKILDLAEELGCSMIYTLGGFGVGRNVEKPRVYGAVNDEGLIHSLEPLGVVLERSGVGHIIGASGLLLGLGSLRGMAGICLMGETSGFYVDPGSAKAVLEVLTKHLGMDVDLEGLEKRARDIEKMTAEAAEMEKRILEEMGALTQPEPMPDKDQMRYIG
ncbi:MAG: proteasome assembly chaperone family protein [Methanobacteriota archaeon]|nr:MAG: proteasome assembly chaperone family protein [Euryarchaeota archaeon]